MSKIFSYFISGSDGKYIKINNNDQKWNNSYIVIIKNICIFITEYGSDNDIIDIFNANYYSNNIIKDKIDNCNKILWFTGFSKIGLEKKCLFEDFQEFFIDENKGLEVKNGPITFTFDEIANNLNVQTEDLNKLMKNSVERLQIIRKLAAEKVKK